MRRHRNSKKYAKMLLNAVGMEGALKALEELALAGAVSGKSPEFRNLLQNPAFTDEERAGAVSAVGRSIGLSEGTVKFVNFLSAEGAAWAMGDVLEKATAIYSERKARVKATVYTAAAMDSAYEGRLKEALKRITGKEVDLAYETSPSLLGGMLIKVGSTMFDGSVKGQLGLLREELIKG